MKQVLNYLTRSIILFFIFGCNNSNETSPYSAVLSQPPYASLTDSIKDNSGNADLYFHRALLLKKNSLPEPALADFKKAWSLKPKEEYAANITALLLEDKPDSVVVFANRALKKIQNSIFLRL